MDKFPINKLLQIAALVICTALPITVFSAQTGLQTIQFTDSELCSFTPRDGSWWHGYNSLRVMVDFNPVTIEIPNIKAGCGNLWNSDGGGDIDVGVFLLPSEPEAIATLDVLRQLVAGYGATVSAFNSNALNALGSVAWMGVFEFEEVAFTRVGRFIVSGYLDWPYSYSKDEKRAELVARMGDAVARLGVIEKDGKLYLSSPPGATLKLSTSDLPPWAGLWMVTVGAIIIDVGPPARVATGDARILLDGLPVARVGDSTTHGGRIVEGSERIFINGIPAALLGGFAACPMMNNPYVPHVGGPIVENCTPDSGTPLECLASADSALCDGVNTGSGRDIRYEEGGAIVKWCQERIRRLDEPALRGNTILTVNGKGIKIGDVVIIGSDAFLSELAKVIGKGSLVLENPLKNSYPRGTLITRVPDEYADPGGIQRELASAVLPSSRSAEIGKPVTAFATIINSGPGTSTGCSISPVNAVAADFLYQTTDPASNALTGTPDTPVDIAEGAAQTFLFSFTPTAPFAPTDVQLRFDCANTIPAATLTGVNTLLLSGSSTPVPDIIALATGTGIVDMPLSTGGTAAFAVATVNMGATGTITASIDTGSASLPVSIGVCETDPVSGVCINPVIPANTAMTTIATGETPTFAFFISASGNIPFDPANNRVIVRFTDRNGTVRGSTSTALRTVQ